MPRLLGLILIATALWLVEFRRFAEFGLVSDDFTRVGWALWERDTTLARKVLDTLLHSWEARPLRFLEIAIYGLVGGRLGIGALYGVTYLALLANVLLVERLVTRRMGAGPGFLAAAFMAVAPFDSTHLWLSTLNHRFGVFWSLLATLAFANGKSRRAALLLAVAAFTYEFSLLAFVLAPWFADGARLKSTARAAGIALGVGALYALYRFFVHPHIGADPRLDAFRSSVGGARSLDALAYLPSALLEVLGRTPCLFLARAAEVPLGIELMAAGAIGLAAFAASARRALVGAEMTEGPRFIPAALLIAIVLLVRSALPLLAGLEESYGPVSRYSYVVTPALALLVAMIGRTAMRISSASGRLSVAILVGALIAVSAASRSGIAADYIAAARAQETFFARAVEKLGPLPERTIVVFLNAPPPAKGAAISTLERAIRWECDGILSLVYDASIGGVIVDTALETSAAARFDVGKSLADAENRWIIVYDDAARATTWWRGPDRDPWPRSVAPGGPALDFLRRPIPAAR